jgi:hypothetical protein
MQCGFKPVQAKCSCLTGYGADREPQDEPVVKRACVFLV